MRPTTAARRAATASWPTIRHVGKRVPLAVVLFAVFVFVAEAGIVAHGRYQQWGTSRIDREDVFGYVSVEPTGRLVEVELNGTPIKAIQMVSTSAWHRHLDRVEWLDRLVCNGGTVSHFQENAAEYAPRPLGTKEWPYKGAWPADGSTCHMVSVITVQVDGRVFVQRVESGTFNPSEFTG